MSDPTLSTKGLRVSQPSHTDIYAELGKISASVEALGAEIKSLRKDVEDLKGLKNKGVGFMAAIALCGALLLLGVKSWIINLVSGAGS